MEPPKKKRGQRGPDKDPSKRKRKAELKKRATIRITDTNRQLLIARYGSLQKAVDHLLSQTTPSG